MEIVVSPSPVVRQSNIDSSVNNKSISQRKNPMFIKRIWWSKVRPCMNSCAIVLFISVSMTIGILTVCLTPRKLSKLTCSFIFTPMDSIADKLDSHPRSIALADFNKDNKTDIIVANSNTDNICIWIGYGNGTFIRQTTYSTGVNSRPYSVIVADLNNDNNLDIVVANYGANNVGIFLGYRNGTFMNQTTYTTGPSRPLQIVSGDFNNDTWLDIAVLNFGTNDIGILFGYADGSFSLQTRYSTGYDSLPSYVVIGDINHDNRLDIIIANNGTGNIGIIFGYNNGTFTEQKIYSTGSGSYPNSIAVGDFNNDSNSDLAVTKNGMNQIEILLGDGNGSFLSAMTFSTGTFVPFFIAVGYFNKDSYQDLAVLYSLNDSLCLWIGSGNGSFEEESKYSTGLGSSSYSIVVGKFDNNSLYDIAVVNSDTNNFGIFLGTYAAFHTRHSYLISTNTYPTFVTVKDINQDNQVDIVVVSSQNNNIGIFLGYGNGSFTDQITYSTGIDSSPSMIVFEDFNHDNRLDIVVLNSVSCGIGILFGYGNGTFQNQVEYKVNCTQFLSSVAVGDLNNDNTQDIIISGAMGDYNICVFLGYGDGTFPNEPIYLKLADPYASSFAIGDFNHDAKLDIVVTKLENYAMVVFFGYGNGTFGKETYYSSNSGSSPLSIFVNDLTNDNNLDVIVAYMDSLMSVFIGHGDGTFYNGILFSLPSGFYSTSITVDDLNNDSRPDLLMANIDDNGVNVFLGYGNGTFIYTGLYSTGIQFQPLSVSVGDLNNDKHSDIVVVSLYFTDISVLLGYDPGALNNQTIYAIESASHPVSITTGDFNNDNRLDLAVVNYGIGSVDVLLGYDNGDFDSEASYSMGTGSLPKSIIVGDFNRDTHLDIAVANYGNNNINVLLGHNNGAFSNNATYDTGSGTGPSSLAIGDFNNDNQLDIAVTNYNVNTVGIFLGFNYPDFDDEIDYPTGPGSGPASMAIDDLNNDTHLDVVVSNSFENTIGIFLGYGNGSFASQTKYSINSYYAFLWIVIADVNSDNRLDIVVGNSADYNLTIFFGYGNGTFSNQTAISNRVSSQVSALAVVDFNNDGKLDIAVASEYFGNVAIFWGHGDGTFENQRTVLTATWFQPNSMAVDDFNHDNKLDIAIANDGIGISIILGFGNKTFVYRTTYRTNIDSMVQSFIIGDVNNDNKTDIIALDANPKSIYIFLGYGNGTFANPTSYLTDYKNTLQPISIADFNNDNRLDIVFVNSIGDAITMLMGNGDGTFSLRAMYSIIPTSPIWYTMTFDDFNEDNQLDIAVVDSSRNILGVLFGHCCDPFHSQTIFSTGSNSHPNSISVGDLNNDNQLDIIVANEGTNNIGFLQGYGNGTFANQTILSSYSGSQPSSVAIADVDNDDCLDIIVANHGNESVSVIFGYGNGSFKSEIKYSIGYGSQPYSLVLDDFNNDTYIDIAVSNDGTNNIGILFGHGNGSFAKVITFSTGYNSQPRSLTVGDFNSDMLLDIAVAMTDANNIGILSKLC